MTALILQESHPRVCKEDIAPLNSGIPTSYGLVLADSSPISAHPVALCLMIRRLGHFYLFAR